MEEVDTHHQELAITKCYIVGSSAKVAKEVSRALRARGINSPIKDNTRDLGTDAP